MGVQKAAAPTRSRKESSVLELERARERIAQELGDLRAMREGKDTLARAVETLERGVQVMHDAMFGFWDNTKNEDVPGLQGRVKNIEGTLVWFKRVVMYVAGPVITFIFLRALGVPTEALGQGIANHITFWQYLIPTPSP